MLSIDKELPPLPPPLYDDVYDSGPTVLGYDLPNATSWSQSATRTNSADRPSSLVSSLEAVDRRGSIEGVNVKKSCWFRKRCKGSLFGSSDRKRHDEGEDVRKLQIYRGWRMSVFVCAATAGTVLSINSMLTLWASLRYGNSGGLATIQEGSCQKTKTLSLWLHLAINILSTILLSASNYCMQCLSSPTREEVDRAHSKQVWLDIGVPGVRNLHQISWSRVALWWALALSGVPLHLLYNSAVFSSLATTEYMVYVASPNLFTDKSVNWSQPFYGGADSTLQDIRNASNWQKLENKECIKAYGQAFVSAHGDLVAISADLNATDPAVYVTGITFEFKPESSTGGPPYSWICQSTQTAGCDLGRVASQAASWTLQNISSKSYRSNSDMNPLPDLVVDYCFSNPVEERCRLQFSLVIMGIVIGCNLVKTICMVLTLWYHRTQPLVTLGDALASFLDQPDPTTENMCLANKYSFARNNNGDTLHAKTDPPIPYDGDKFTSLCTTHHNDGRTSPTSSTLEEEVEFTKKWVPGAKKWQTRHYRWFNSATLRRWLICNILCGSTILTALLLALMGVSASQLTSNTFSHLWALGYGTVTSEQMVTWSNLSGSSGLMATILIANSPQALLSFLFLTYNGLFTCMLLADEWSGYAYKRKPLRVTSPVGEQRSTYRLQLPYRYGIPLLCLSGTLHWLVSQSLFLARVTAFSDNGRVEDTHSSISTIGYSSIAIITVIVLGTIVVLLGIGMGFRRYKPGMPLVGSCSAAISAACHRPNDDVDASRKAVMWGVVGVENGVGHCCFTSLEVEKPVEGDSYAGWGMEMWVESSSRQKED